MISIKKEGSAWQSFVPALVRVPFELASESDKQIAAFAERTRLHIVDGIKQRQFKVADILPSTLARRTDPGSPPLIDTKAYVDHIEVIRDLQGYRVGFRDGLQGPGKRVLERNAQQLEYGTSRMKARPHWRPTLLWAKNNSDGIPLAVVKSLSISRVR